jgi:hypothetical protein
MTLKRRFNAWLRVTYLDRWIVALVAILLVVTLVATVKGLSIPLLNGWGYTQFWLPVAAVMAGGYGYWRARHFHPLANLPYGEWLYNQPWLHPQGLPMGPWHFVLQDALFVLLLAGAAMVGGPALPLYFDTSPLNCALVAAGLFLAGYTWGTWASAAFSHEKYGGLGIPLFYASLLWVWRYPLVVTALMVGAAALAHFSGRRQLVHFHSVYPWRASPATDRYSLTLEGNGWPYDYLQLAVRNPIISLEQALSLSVVAGWCAATLAHLPYLYTSTRALPRGDYEDLATFGHTLLWGLSFLIVLTRGGNYFRGMRMPISLLGRIATGNWIIPRFDRVLVSLVLLLLIGGFLPVLFTKFLAPLEAMAGITVFLLVLVALGMGPTLHDWWHAGDQTLVFRKKKQTTYVSTQ